MCARHWTSSPQNPRICRTWLRLSPAVSGEVVETVWCYSPRLSITVQLWYLRRLLLKVAVSGYPLPRCSLDEFMVMSYRINLSRVGQIYVWWFAFFSAVTWIFWINYSLKDVWSVSLVWMLPRFIWHFPLRRLGRSRGSTVFKDGSRDFPSSPTIGKWQSPTKTLVWDIDSRELCTQLLLTLAKK